MRNRWNWWSSPAARCRQYGEAMIAASSLASGRWVQNSRYAAKAVVFVPGGMMMRQRASHTDRFNFNVLPRFTTPASHRCAQMAKTVGTVSWAACQQCRRRCRCWAADDFGKLIQRRAGLVDVTVGLCTGSGDAAESETPGQPCGGHHIGRTRLRVVAKQPPVRWRVAQFRQRPGQAAGRSAGERRQLLGVDGAPRRARVLTDHQAGQARDLSVAAPQSPALSPPAPPPS